MQENWKAVPGYEGKYEVSDQGRVKSLVKDRYLSPNRMNHGYTCVHLYTNGKQTRKVFTIHKLVATLFIENPRNAREVNHKNFIRHDNRIENLEWVTRKENVSHAIAAGRRHYPEKIVKGINIKTGRILCFKSQIEAEITLRGKQTGGISAAMKRNKPAYGYVWWYA